jgi:hypothetical protein
VLLSGVRVPRVVLLRVPKAGGGDDVEPTVGTPELSRHRTTCSYSLKPGTRRCGAPTTVHLLVYSDTWGLVSLSTCRAHEGYARAAGELLGVHRFAYACANPQARWFSFPPDPTVSECVAPALMPS